MSKPNVDLARRALEAHSRGDRATWLALHDDRLEFTPIRDWPEPGGRGSEAVWEVYAAFFDLFEPVPIADVEIVDCDGDKVMIHSRYPMRGSASGVEVNFDYWLVLTVRDGRIVRNDWFSSRAEALEAAGLSGG